MSRITDWAERRWVERFVDGDNPGLQVANEMLVYSKYEREVEQPGCVIRNSQLARR